ncbi:hypothetical protein SBRY_10972 [Actinacidiphila bryophytorum]|uniref:Uncharacterized protein n=1 Tax=Actinacidiphila bryophytorum TaxID=1436133 RepID=A0A9W4E2S6_9ACTN|nr:hypothetical protein SBRY_10972 [Actinacidiphila bryophytorum]
MARRPRDRHPLQRPLLRGLGQCGQLEPGGLEERDRPSHRLRHPVADEHRLLRRRAAALRLRQGADRRPHSVPARPEPVAADRERPGLPLRRQLAGREPGLAVEEDGRVGPAAAADPLPRAHLRGAVHGLQHAGQPVAHGDQQRPAQLPVLARAGHGVVHRRVRAGVPDQPGALLHRQPLRGVERRDLHGRRREDAGTHRLTGGERRPHGVLPAVRRLARRAGPRATGPTAHSRRRQQAQPGMACLHRGRMTPGPRKGTRHRDRHRRPTALHGTRQGRTDPWSTSRPARRTTPKPWSARC